MTSVKSKSVRKRIKTVLTIKLMEGRTLRDMYREFFGDKAPKGFEERVVRTLVSFDNCSVDYETYKKFSGFGASREFLEAFDFRYVKEYKSVDSSNMISAMYEIVPFTTISGLTSIIISYSVGASRLESSYDLGIEIETYSWKNYISADEVKRINKENARKLRHYLVGLPSVQGVPYTCTFREDEIAEMECSV